MDLPSFKRYKKLVTYWHFQSMQLNISDIRVCKWLGSRFDSWLDCFSSDPALTHIWIKATYQVTASWSSNIKRIHDNNTSDCPLQDYTNNMDRLHNLLQIHQTVTTLVFMRLKVVCFTHVTCLVLTLNSWWLVTAYHDLLESRKYLSLCFFRTNKIRRAPQACWKVNLNDSCFWFTSLFCTLELFDHQMIALEGAPSH